MVRVNRCAVLILYCICQLLSVSLAAPQNSWRADHDTHKLPGNDKRHQSQQQQHHHLQHPHEQQQQEQHHYQSITPATIDNVYYMGVDSNNAVNVAAVGVSTDNKNNKPDSVNVQARDYFIANRIEKPRLLEQSDKRFDDGHYEYSYTLSNGDTRYERAYWLPTGSEIILARKGYYSYPLPDNKYHTVFYTSDQNGFQQDSSAYSNGQPTLPRTVTVPEHPVSQNQYGVIQHPNNVPAMPAVVSGIPQYNNNYVVSQVPHAGVGHWNSQGTYENDGSYKNHGQYKRVRRNINEEKVEESVDKTKSSHTTQKPEDQLPRTTETPVVKSEKLKEALPKPTVELPRVENVDAQTQQQVAEYSQQPNVQTYSDLRDPTYHRQNYQNTPIVQRQQVPMSGTYSVPNQINTLNRQTIPAGSQTDFNAYNTLNRQTIPAGSQTDFNAYNTLNRQTIPGGSQTAFNAYNTLNGPILGNRQSELQQVPQTPEQQQQIINQNALLNYLASRMSDESSESYSQESHELYLAGLLAGNNQPSGSQGGTLGTTGGLRNQQTRRRIRGNIPIWPLQQQQLAQRFY